MKKFNITKYIRPCCESFEPYIAGRPIDEIKRSLGLKTVIKLASNENPLGPSKKAASAIKAVSKKAYFYPDSNSSVLRGAIAGKFKVNPLNVVLGAGSDEIIELIGKTFFKPGDEIVISEKSFIRYKMAGDLMDASVVVVPMKNYTHDLDGMFKAINSMTKAVFIANPNNPTGTYNTRAEFEKFMEKTASLKRPPLVVMDEAYYEYARINRDYPETLKYIQKYPNLIVLRTFSKVYGLAGLRVGYGFSSKDVIGYLNRLRPPFNINLVAQEAATASLSDNSQVKRSLSLVKKEKKYLYGQLKVLNIPFIPSVANFVLIDLKPLKGKEVFEKLLRKGVIVRAMDEYDLPNMIRVSIGLPDENRIFIKALKEVI